MNKKLKIIVGILFVICLAIGINAMAQNQDLTVRDEIIERASEKLLQSFGEMNGFDTFGSVNVSHEYNTTSTRNWSNRAIAKATEFNQTISSSTRGTVILGSVIVASTSPASMKIFNATSTAGVTNGDYDIVGEFPTSTPQGTYTFDVELSRGLVVQLQASFAGDYIFTWRK